MWFIVKAKQYGDSVTFKVPAENIKDARDIAHTEANRIYRYEGFGDLPTVDVKEEK